MISHFEMLNVGLMSYFFVIKVIQLDNSIIIIFQKKYASDVLQKIKNESL